MLLRGWSRDVGNLHHTRDVEADELEDAGREDLPRQVAQTRSADLRPQVRETNRSGHGRPEEAESERLEKDLERLGRGHGRSRREERLHSKNRRAKAQIRHQGRYQEAGQFRPLDRVRE